MSFGLYAIGFTILIGGLIYAAYLGACARARESYDSLFSESLSPGVTVLTGQRD
jgi:hypothetical protein